MLVPFRAKGHLDWPSLGQSSLPATFSVPGTPAVTIRLVLEEAEDTSLSVVVTAEASFEPPDPVLTNLRDINAGVQRATEETLAFGVDVRRTFRQAAGRVLGVLAWRVGDPLITSSASFGPSEFRLGEDWGYVPMNVGASFLFSAGTQLTLAQIDDVNALLVRDLSEPLAHTVWREAWRLHGQSPRGSLVLGVSALEIGLKEFIAARVPDAAWLVQEAPTPPLMKMLQRYLPDLTAADPVPFQRLEAPLSTTVQDAIERRNKAAHSSQDSLVGHGLKATLHALRRVIYLLDSQDGHAWTRDQDWHAN